MVQFGRSTIPYRIVRSHRQKTVAVGIDAVEGVRVRAPRSTPVSKLDQIVHRKAKWIVERRRRHEDLPPTPSAREFVSGETFLYLGRQYRLKVVRREGSNPVGVRLVGGHLVVAQPGGRSSRKSETRKLLEEWYRARARDRLPGRVPTWAEKLGLEPTAVLIREQRKRWGSADTRGVVRLNWRVVQAPQRLVDYVLAHELAHLRFRDHTREFWATVGAVMPDYEGRREDLRRLGRLIVW